MKYWSWTGRIFTVVGIILIAIGLFSVPPEDVSLESELELGNIAVAFLAPGFCLFVSGLLILAIRSCESGKKSP